MKMTQALTTRFEVPLSFLVDEVLRSATLPLFVEYQQLTFLIDSFFFVSFSFSFSFSFLPTKYDTIEGSVISMLLFNLFNNKSLVGMFDSKVMKASIEHHFNTLNCHLPSLSIINHLTRSLALYLFSRCLQSSKS